MARKEVPRLRIPAPVPPSGENHVRHSQCAETPEDRPHHGFVESDGAGESEPSNGPEQKSGNGEGKTLEQQPATGARGGIGEARRTEIGDVTDGMDKAEIKKKGRERMENDEDRRGEEKLGHGSEPSGCTLDPAPNQGDNQTGNPEPCGGCGYKSESSIESGHKGGAYEKGKEVTGGLRMKDERCNGRESTARDDFHRALWSVQVFGIAEAEMDHGDGKKYKEGCDRRGHPRDQD